MSLADSEFEDAGLADAGFEEAGFEEAGFEEAGFEEADDAPMKGGPDVPEVVQPTYRKQGFSIYTILLMLAFVFLVTATVLFFQEVERFK